MSDLENYRKKIDGVDEELLKLLNQRARYNSEIGKIKKQSNHAVYAPGRETQIFENLLRWNQGPLSQEAVEHIFKAILAKMKELQQQAMQEPH